MKKKRLSTIFTIAGVLLIAASLSLTIFNIWSENRAAKASEEILKNWEQIGEDQNEGEIPDYMIDPDMDMPTKEIDGNLYIGRISIPELELNLPIMNEWSYPKLRIAPCRYQGSIYSNDLMIAAHNYNRHFGMLKTLKNGSKVILKDAADHVFYYKVSSVEILEPREIKKISLNHNDLVLFTCTIGGRARVTVRCDRVTDGLFEK